MQPFEYRAPTTLQEALALLAEPGRRARPLAGGTDLVVQMRIGAHMLDRVVDIKKIPELAQLAFDPAQGLRIGATVACATLEDYPPMRTAYPGLWEAVSIIGGAAIHNRATVGGNLCNAAPSGDSIPALIVHRAHCEIAGQQGKRQVAVENFCTAPGKTVLQPGELLLAIHVPTPLPHAGARYQRFIPRGEMDISVASAAVWVRLNVEHTRIEEARIALGAVAPTPLWVAEAGEALVGRAPDEATMAAAARLAQEACRPISDMRGTAAQRRHLVGVLVQRALRDAVRRASGQPLTPGGSSHD